LTTYNHEPGLSRSKSLKMAVIAGAALLVLGASALAYAGVSSQHDAAGSAAKAALAAQHPTIGIGVVSGAPAIPVEVPVRFSDADGLGSASITVAYDPKVVTLVDARNGAIAKSQLTWRHDASEGVIVMLLTTSLPDGLSGDGALSVLTLTAKDGAVGQVSPLTVTVKSAVHADGTQATLEAASGTFRNGVPGDVNGDGKVDTSDYDRLASYLVGENVTIVTLNADLNGDGKVTEADAVRLLQQLDGASAKA